MQPGSGGASAGVTFDQAPVDDAVARAWTPSPDLRFTVAPPAIENGYLRVRGTLTNAGSVEHDAIYLTGGAMFTSTNPFSVSVPLSVRPFDRPETPEVYPAPQRAVLPP